MFNKLIFTISFISLTMYTIVAQQADDIIGSYHLPNDLDIKIYKVNDSYNGAIIALNSYGDSQKKDVKNPDKSKREELILGKVIIKELEFDAQNKKWINGKMYGPEKGMTFNLKIIDIQEKEIKVVGSKYLFWKTLTWIKI